jgi:putative membrane protein
VFFGRSAGDLRSVRQPQKEDLMVKWGLAGALALALVVPAAGMSAAHARSTTLSGLDKHFLKTSAQGDVFEVKGGQMAQSKGSDASVKSLGTTLTKDHSKSLLDVVKAARKFGVKLEKKPTPSQSWELAQVSSTSGKSFDQAYAKLEVNDHIEDIEDATEEVQNGSNPTVRSLAKQDLPMLKKHLALSKAALKKVS